MLAWKPAAVGLCAAANHARSPPPRTRLPKRERGAKHDLETTAYHTSKRLKVIQNEFRTLAHFGLHLVGIAVLQNERLAMMHAHRILARLGAIGAQIALIRDDRHERILVLIRAVLPWTDLGDENASLVIGIAVFDPTGDFARMAARTVIVIDEYSLAPHGYRSPSDTLYILQISDLQFAPNPVEPNSGGTSWFAFDENVSKSRSGSRSGNHHA